MKSVLLFIFLHLPFWWLQCTQVTLMVLVPYLMAPSGSKPPEHDTFARNVHQTTWTWHFYQKCWMHRFVNVICCCISFLCKLCLFFKIKINTIKICWLRISLSGVPEKLQVLAPLLVLVLLNRCATLFLWRNKWCLWLHPLCIFFIVCSQFDVHFSVIDYVGIELY